MLDRTALLLEALGPSGLTVPLVHQSNDHACAAAALAAVLRYWRPTLRISDQALLGPLRTSASLGTDIQQVAKVARLHGLRAELLDGTTLDELRRRLRLGQTVILNFQAWPRRVRRTVERRDGHFAVLVGEDGSRLYLMDPWLSGTYGHVTAADLLAAWVDNDGNARRAVAIWGGGKPISIGNLGPTRRIETKPRIK